ncbi:hypothetical protein C8A05DRAFT_18514 [Staphylotrichum tortipilum]|uniref:Uncharacterized protein n=1 Tax=Staphylotrichum tortipilum TaxID=2831512 RepID=A0AAN6RR03_9PEZI|nr:hypothetical protein C8A05DRAFT_18514 [Staphylotrichum longicolle]
MHAAKGHHRSRSSIDRVIELLADLEETQITLLLDDLNHTTSSNVPVTDAIALFEHHASRPKRRSCRSPSPMRTLQAELERRHSKRVSAVPAATTPSAGGGGISAAEPRPRRRSAAPQSPLFPQSAVSPPPPTPAPSSTPLAPPPPPSRFDDFFFDFDRPTQIDVRPPSPTPSPPPVSMPASLPMPIERSKPSGPPPSFRPRSYKRVSRPMFLSPTATAELHLLLLAFFSETPISPMTTATPSPTTPLFGFSHAPFSDLDFEPSTPGLDLLEPSPLRTPSLAPARSLRTMPSIGSIFEGLR